MKLTTSSRKQSHTHEEVFGHLSEAMLTAAEAADYLEVSMTTFSRIVGVSKVASNDRSNQMYSTAALRELKQHDEVAGRAWQATNFGAM